MSLLGPFTVTVDGRVVAEHEWSRRGAASLVKLLALTPARAMHREQVIDALWPDDLLERAAPKLHKAAHFARRTLDSTDAVVLVDERVLLFPDRDVAVDVVETPLEARELGCANLLRVGP